MKTCIVVLVKMFVCIVQNYIINFFLNNQKQFLDIFSLRNIAFSVNMFHKKYYKFKSNICAVVTVKVFFN